MVHKLLLMLTWVVLLAIAWRPSERFAQAQSPIAAPVFEHDVLPILSAHCLQCHGNDNPPAGLDLRTAASVLKGGAQGPVVTKGSADSSSLVQRVANHTMPPKGIGQPLSDVQVETIRKWVEAGAPALQPSASATVPPVSNAASNSPAPDTPLVSAKDRQFWAFRKPVRAAVPKLKNALRVRTPIDAFVLAKLEAKGVAFSPDAPKLTLMRRAYYDLIGLPPSPEEIQAYIADNKPDAYERLIDRLLASQHYGERWGRHWLDVAGYNDEQGFANDLSILVMNDGIWRYRDYVIRSLNQDKPYNQFLTEQLAGDELVDWRNAQKFTPQILDSLIATGYLRLMTDLTDSSEVNLPPYYYDVLTRLVDNFSSGVLGITGQCARCHSHKYDPIPQRDYYRMAAIFATGYNPEEWKRPKERFLPDVSKTEQQEMDRYNAEIDRPLGDLTKKLANLRHPHERRLFESKLAAVVPEALRNDIRMAFDAPADKRTDVQKYFVKKLETAVKVAPEEVDKELTESERASSRNLETQIATLKSWRHSFEKIQALWNVGKPPTMHLLRRGMYETPGPVVTPGFFEVASEPGQFTAVRPPEAKGEAGGFRLALGHWVTREDNPLTARVIVNRIWMNHFGRGIVATPENFGRMGTPPTHPELLDWLAVDFMENGWRFKRLHKLIMISTAYRQSSRQPAENEKSVAEEVDPGNELLWRMNLHRVEAEVLRDAILAGSGKLDTTMGGPPVGLDATPEGLVTVAEKGATPTSQFRRSVYLLARRNYASSFLDVFDFPVMALNCTRRTNSATPLQSLTMINGEFVMRRAEDFAVRILDSAGPGAPVEKEIERAFLVTLSRKPTNQEIGWSAEHIEKEAKRYLELKAAPDEALKKALASVCQMLMATNEFLYIE